MSYLHLRAEEPPPSPAAGKVKLYRSFDESTLHAIDETGTDEPISEKPNSRNLIGNSGFWFAQRLNPSAVSTFTVSGSKVTVPDRFWVNHSSAGGTSTYQRKDATGEVGLTGRWYGEYKKITFSSRIMMWQTFERSISRSVTGLPLTVSFKMRAVGGTARFAFSIIGYTNVAAEGNPGWTLDNIPYSYPRAVPAAAKFTDCVKALENCRSVGNAASFEIDNTWRRYSAVFFPQGPWPNTGGTFSDVVGNLSLTIWSWWELPIGRGFDISEVVVHPGIVSPQWVPESYEKELQRVQRHMWKTFNIDQQPQNTLGLGTGEWRDYSWVPALTAVAGYTVPFPVEMFPTNAGGGSTIYNPSAPSNSVRDVTAGQDCTVSTFTGNGDNRVLIQFTTPAAGAPGDELAAHFMIAREL